MQRGTQQTEHWLPRFDVMVIGPGLGRDAWVHDTVVNVSFVGDHQRHRRMSDPESSIVSTRKQCRGHNSIVNVVRRRTCLHFSWPCCLLHVASPHGAPDHASSRASCRPARAIVMWSVLHPDHPICSPAGGEEPAQG